MTDVLIAGCGYVGCALAEALLPHHRVWAIRRDVSKLPTGVRPLARDMGQPFELPADVRFEWVFYTAAASEFTPQAFATAYVDGPRHLVAALRAGGHAPKRLFYTSSTGVYAQHQGETVNEQSPAVSADFTGKAVLAGESGVLGCGWPATAVRYAGIYGPGRAALLHDLKAGRAGLIAQPTYANLIHRDDCVGVLLHLMRLPSAPDVVVACDPYPTDRNDLVRWLAAELGMAAHALPTQALPPMARGRKRCDSTWLQHSGYRFHHPSYQDGYRALMRSEGLLHG